MHPRIGRILEALTRYHDHAHQDREDYHHDEDRPVYRRNGMGSASDGPILRFALRSRKVAAKDPNYRRQDTANPKNDPQCEKRPIIAFRYIFGHGIRSLRLYCNWNEDTCPIRSHGGIVTSRFHRRYASAGLQLEGLGRGRRRLSGHKLIGLVSEDALCSGRPHPRLWIERGIGIHVLGRRRCGDEVRNRVRWVRRHS